MVEMLGAKLALAELCLMPDCEFRRADLLIRRGNEWGSWKWGEVGGVD